MKKILCVLIALLMITGSSFVATGASAESTYTPPEEFIYGDVDMDGEVTVRDATLVQKGVAEVVYLTAVQRYLADTEGEGFSVRNATAIQKHLAGLDTASSVDEVVKMTYTDKFSQGKTLNALFEGRYLVITPKNADYDYTLADFPELNFSRIEKTELSYSKRTYYMLYLQEPGKENLLEALKALDYRANFDLKYVNLDEYVLPA
ncbi:MAG: dockerin type I repeat-containing protein [Ruminococcus sp.]|nr:dockerin type I repeat-containing protein [Ruminococcus sp.]